MYRKSVIEQVVSVDGNARTTSQKHDAVYICTKVGGGREHSLGNLLGDLCRGGYFNLKS